MAAEGIVVRILGDATDLDKSLSASANKIAKWATAIKAVADVAAVAFVASGLKAADAQAKLAAQLGTTSQDLATTARAFDMAGVSQEKLNGGVRALTNRLSQASSGVKEASAAFDQLGVSASEIQSLPLSERIATINAALKNNVAANERAALAAKLYGEEAGLAISRVDAATIDQASAQVKKLNAALSEVDAAKVEAANDAIGQIGMATEGVAKQLAAKFAPVLQGLAETMVDMVTSSDEFGNIATSAFNVVIKGAGYAANAFRGMQVIADGLVVAFHGVRVVISEVATRIVESFDWAINGAKEIINDLIDAANHIPGINLEKLVIGESELAASMRAATEEMKADFSSAVDNMHNRLMEPLPSESLDEWVKVWEEKAQKAAEIAANAKAKEREEAATAHVDDMDAVRARYAEQLAVLEEYEAARSGTIKLWKAEDIKTAEDAAKAQKAIDQASMKARMQVASSMMGNLSSLMDTENRKLFQIGKVAALAQATIDGYSSIVSSYAQGAKIGGPALGAAFAATAAVATGVQISRIAAASYGGGTGAPAAAATSNPGVSSDGLVGGSGAQTETQRTIRLESLDPTALVSGSMINTLAQNLVELQNDGFKLVV